MLSLLILVAYGVEKNPDNTELVDGEALFDTSGCAYSLLVVR